MRRDRGIASSWRLPDPTSEGPSSRLRQAIEEGFILDVLKYYTTYAIYFKLLKASTDDAFDRILNKASGHRFNSLSGGQASINGIPVASVELKNPMTRQP